MVGGRGVLLGGVPGVPPGDVNAALIAIGFGADVIMAGQSMDQLRQASARFGPRLRTVFSARQTVETLCRRVQLVAVLNYSDDFRICGLGAAALVLADDFIAEQVDVVGLGCRRVDEDGGGLWHAAGFEIAVQ